MTHGVSAPLYVIRLVGTELYRINKLSDHGTWARQAQNDFGDFEIAIRNGSFYWTQEGAQLQLTQTTQQLHGTGTWKLDQSQYVIWDGYDMQVFTASAEYAQRARLISLKYRAAELEIVTVRMHVTNEPCTDRKSVV